MRVLGYFFLLIIVLLAHVWKESRLSRFSIEIRKLKTEKEILQSEKNRLLGELSVEASIVEIEKKALDMGFIFPAQKEISEVWPR